MESADVYYACGVREFAGKVCWAPAWKGCGDRYAGDAGGLMLAAAAAEEENGGEEGREGEWFGDGLEDVEILVNDAVGGAVGVGGALDAQEHGDFAIGFRQVVDADEGFAGFLSYEGGEVDLLDDVAVGGAQAVEILVRQAVGAVDKPERGVGENHGSVEGIFSSEGVTGFGLESVGGGPGDISGGQIDFHLAIFSDDVERVAVAGEEGIDVSTGKRHRPAVVSGGDVEGVQGSRAGGQAVVHDVGAVIGGNEAPVIGGACVEAGGAAGVAGVIPGPEHRAGVEVGGLGLHLELESGRDGCDDEAGDDGDGRGRAAQGDGGGFGDVAVTQATVEVAAGRNGNHGANVARPVSWSARGKGGGGDVDGDVGGGLSRVAGTVEQLRA